MERDNQGRFIQGHKFNLGRKLPNKKSMPKKGLYKNCEICDLIFYVHQSGINRKYCKPKCYYKSKIGKPGPMLGKRHSKESNEKNRLAHMDKKTGKDSPNWKGGIYPKVMLIRRSARYQFWRNSVFDRDNYTCRFCGNKNCYLEAHHVIPFSDCYKRKLIDNIFQVDNGITLCKRCHKGYHFNDEYSWAQKSTIV